MRIEFRYGFGTPARNRPGGKVLFPVRVTVLGAQLGAKVKYVLPDGYSPKTLVGKGNDHAVKIYLADRARIVAHVECDGRDLEPLYAEAVVPRGYHVLYDETYPGPTPPVKLLTA